MFFATGMIVISIHALRVEGDLSFVVFCQHLRPFLSTPSGWRATFGYRGFSPRRLISIHALRVEGDFILIQKLRYYFISIHALRVEGDNIRRAVSFRVKRFLSTPSGWRATLSQAARNVNRFLFLSTPSGWRATDGEGDKFITIPISIHALRVEGDWYNLDRK